MNECTFIILGATGDLTKRKLIPAIYWLVKDKKIDKFAIIGVANSKSNINQILSESKKFIKKVDGRVWRSIEASCYYQQFDFYKPQDFLNLKDVISIVEKKHKLSGNRLFYLATWPQHFEVITKNLVKSGIVEKYENQKQKKVGWSRIVYEKPFGYDLKSARKINQAILKLFNENQIYRIDHYLGKELVGNIELVRFTNRVFEPLWCNKHIDSIQIILSENICVEGRGKSYDSCGAINDVVQGHMLQIMALVGMEAPKMLSGKYIRDAKEKVLEKVIVDDVLLAQYEGYLKEKGVAHKSKTETFGAVKLYIDNRRWHGVPFYLKTGKCLDKKEIGIHIRFKMVKCLLNQSCPSDSNYLTIKIQPDEGFFLELNTKVPGKNEVTPVKMDFCHTCLFGQNTPKAYEVLLEDVIRGDQSYFLRSDEILESWRIVEKIKKLAKNKKLYSYKKGSSGPVELEKFDKAKKLRWRG
jgi:glucose-6-phosphate 1-dehydrogenase